MAPIAVEEATPNSNESNLKTTQPPTRSIVNGDRNGSNATAPGASVNLHELRTRPNLELWVTKEHEIFMKPGSFPFCGPTDCVVHVKATGICGSEIHFWKHGRIGDCLVTHPIILGHESAGQVIQVGSEVKGLQVGDRVSIEPGVSCWECERCLEGRYNICPNVVFSGTPPSDGTMRRFVAHPARYLHKIPDKMTYALGALIEPLSVAYQALQRASLSHYLLGLPLLIAGAGPIGLAVTICAKAAGCYPIIITDLEAGRLQQAKDAGADLTLKVDMGWTREQVAQEVKALAKGQGIPLAIEATGSEQSIGACCYSLQEGGSLIQVGCGKPNINLPLMMMGFKEINITTSFRYRLSWPTLIRLVASGRLGNVGQLITHTLPLEKAEEAMRIAADRNSGAVKVQIVD